MSTRLRMKARCWFDLLGVLGLFDDGYLEYLLAWC
jgi:hypothetical protein